ncbi:hypothetical protein [Clostridium sp. AM33-3]|uniref:hypothetical protein n=1 Tax=Clostridium sp. AM33-3 TaxID=2292304 RepID=UPI000E53B7BF|nr:hypothetical protein [Clostridium sp. AM33-3]RHT21009.1 hypothetical protein DW819_08780 [Clostridium sp. AM33-3]
MNEAWKINQDTKDLCFDDAGILETIEEDEAAAQGVRMALTAFQGDFDLVPEHGTDYEQILGLPVDDETTDEVIREAIFQEDRVAMIDELIVNMDKRAVEISFSGTLNDGKKVSMEVSVGE